MLYVLRGIFILLATLLTSIAFENLKEPLGTFWWQGALTGFGLSLALVALEIAFARRLVTMVSLVILGVIFGFIIARIFFDALNLTGAIKNLEETQKHYIEFAFILLFCFISIIVLIRTKDEFKFVIPFIELSKEGRYGKPLILDTSAIIDGRIADMLENKLFDSPVILPRFILNEIQNLADSHDKLKRGRGRRGLDMLNRLRKMQGVDLRINDLMFPETKEIDSKLIRLTKMLDGKLVTTDFSLVKVAQVQGVEAININTIAQILKTPYIQGDRFSIKLVKPGENPGQAVGYLEDGTMIVVEDAAKFLGKQVNIVVTNVIQTSAGRLIFGKII